MTTEARTTFTPGPWRVRYAEPDGLTRRDIPRVLGADGLAVANASARPERDANARLIAAAPEMYEALRTIAGPLNDAALGIWSETMFDALQAARAALAKAEGK